MLNSVVKMLWKYIGLVINLLILCSLIFTFLGQYNIKKKVVIFYLLNLIMLMVLNKEQIYIFEVFRLVL